MDLFENRNKKLDIPHLSTAKYVQFALSIQYFSYIVDYVCSILQQNHLHIHISQFTTHNSLLVSRIPHLTTLYLHHSSHNSQLFTRITHPTSHNSLLASLISQLFTHIMSRRAPTPGHQS